MRHVFIGMLGLVCAFLGAPLGAQDTALNFSTVERPPFSFQENGTPHGFSIDLMEMIADELGREVRFSYADSFPRMLDALNTPGTDGAIANISITAARETAMDFSQPIFESGLQIMVAGNGRESTIWSAIFRADLLLAILAAFAMLFLMGLLMWFCERNRQPYFDRPAKEAMFPSFWWALNLVVNGGFEERMPRSLLGRFLGVLMVISSLFLVSIFVAHITAQLTVEAITATVSSIEDLDGRHVGTTEGSTSSTLLTNRGVTHTGYADLDEVIAAFEAQELEAVVFDGPILAYYIQTKGRGKARLVNRVFRPENYGIALPEGSPLREPINRALLKLTESGQYQELVVKYFGVRG